MRWLLIFVIILAIIFGGGYAALQVTSPDSPAQAQQSSDKYDGDCTGKETEGRCADKPAAFDHSNCQYPDRTTNPVDGCDNSDPCDPAQVKGGSGDCVTLPDNNNDPVITAEPGIGK